MRDKVHRQLSACCKLRERIWLHEQVRRPFMLKRLYCLYTHFPHIADCLLNYLFLAEDMLKKETLIQNSSFMWHCCKTSSATEISHTSSSSIYPWFLLITASIKLYSLIKQRQHSIRINSAQNIVFKIEFEDKFRPL